MIASWKQAGLPILVGAALLAGSAPPVRAQQNPYNPYYVPAWSGYGPGGTLQGVAAGLDATGNQWIQRQQAQLVGQQAEQAKLVTKKQTFDLMQYERANTPTYTEVQEKTDAMKIRRLLNAAIPGEIQNGSAMNTLMPYLLRLTYQGTHGAPVPLDPTLMRQINVTTATQFGGIGLLANVGDLNWPFALRGPTQQRVDDLLTTAVSAAARNNLQPDTYFAIKKDVDKLSDELSKNFRQEKFDGGMYLEGRRFLDSLNDSLRVLQSPNAANYFNGTYAARGNTVDELLQYMAQQGLKFGPMAPGGAAAYQSLYNAMVAFAAGAQNDSGFRMRTAPGQQVYGQKG
jgi:hypothetical protein